MAEAKKRKRRATPAKTRAKKKVPKDSEHLTPKALHHPLPSSWRLLAAVWSLFRANWRVLTGIVVVYLILNIVFASGLSNLNSAVTNIHNNLSADTVQTHRLARAASGFGLLVGTAGASGSASASLLQSALFVIESLAVIWALRQLSAGNSISVKEAYYHSTFPLIPFLLVLLVIFIQLMPVTFGAVLVNAVLTTAAANVTFVVVLAWLVFLLLAAWSVYLVCGSIFALYIVTIPDVHPRDALRAAHNLVRLRRSALIPKIVFLPIFTLVVMAILMVPLLMVTTTLVAPVFYILSMFAFLFIHSYLYSLYRSLLG